MTTYKILIKDLFLDAFWEIFYFPLWWYSRGLRKATVYCWQRIRGGWRTLGLSVILRNFFKPMYGQKGWDAYFLSIGTHLVQLLWRILFFLAWSFFWISILFLWLTLFIIIIWQLIY